MTPENIRTYVMRLGLVSNPIITLLGRGESNINYLVKDQWQVFVVRTQRGDMPKHSRFESEHHFLKFIEVIGIKFAPHSIHYDPEADIHIVGYIHGSDASIVDLNDGQTKIFIEQLERLNGISYESYAAWCKQNQLAPFAPQTSADRNKMYIEAKIESIRRHAANPFSQIVLAWAEPKIKALYAAAPGANLKTRFMHDDLRWNEGGGNLKIAEGNIYFIDWELSGFIEAPLEIGDVLGSLPSAYEKTIGKRLYETYITDVADRDEVDNSIRYGVLWGKIGNPLWAAERYLSLNANGHSELERYRILAENGMKDAERFYTEPFSEWYR